MRPQNRLRSAPVCPRWSSTNSAPWSRHWLAGRPGLGVEVAGHVNPAFTRDLFDVGLRRFTSTAGQSEELRLALGQFASEKSGDHG